MVTKLGDKGQEEAMSVDHDLGSRRGWMWLVALLAGLGALETIGALLIARALLPLTAAVAVDAILVSWTVVALWIFASPLWGQVEVDSNGLRVRFGLVGSIWVPIEAIHGAALHTTQPRTPLQLGAGFVDESRQIALVRSTTSDSVLVRFRLPVAGRVQLFKPVMATSLVVTTSGAVALSDAINAFVRAAEDRAGVTGPSASSGT